MILPTDLDEWTATGTAEVGYGQPPIMPIETTEDEVKADQWLS